MTELVIHIGTMKTGTTALQKYLSQYRDRLFEECGLLFPRSAEVQEGSHHNLVYEVTGSWKYVATRGGFSDLEREIAATSPRSVLVSAENLSSYGVVNPDVAPAFGAFSKRMGMPLTVVCYVRPQWEYMDSYYSEGVKGGYTTCSFDRFVDDALREPMYDYEQVVRPWEPFSNQILVRPYPGKQLIAEFSRLLGLFDPPETVVDSMRWNTRFGAKRLEFMLRMGAALERTRAPFKRRIPIAHRLRDAIAVADLDDVPFSGLDSGVVCRIHGHFEDGNRRLSERFGMTSTWHTLPSGPFHPSTFNMAQASQEDFRVFEDVVAQVFLKEEAGP